MPIILVESLMKRTQHLSNFTSYTHSLNPYFWRNGRMPCWSKEM